MTIVSTRTSSTIDRVLAVHARRLKINVSAAASQGVEASVRAAMAQSDRDAYRRRPEVTTSMRNIAAEVDFDYERPLRSESVRTGCQPAGTSPGDQDSRQGRARKARKVSLNGFGA